MIRETAYESLERVAKIKDLDQRKKAFRDLLISNNSLAIVVQRTYHPEYNFILPKGDLPDTIAKKSNHDEGGPFYQSMRKWDIFRPVSEVPTNANLKKHVVESQFVDLYEAVSTLDSDLLIAVKDKKLPWASLDAEFVVQTIPELFPAGFRPGDKTRGNINHDEGTTIRPTNMDKIPTQSKREQCLWIIQSNPGLKRKEYIELFERIGVSKSTAGLYYQQLKDLVE